MMPTARAVAATIRSVLGRIATSDRMGPAFARARELWLGRPPAAYRRKNFAGPGPLDPACALHSRKYIKLGRSLPSATGGTLMRKTVDHRRNSMSRRRFLGTAAGAGVAAAAGHSLPSLSGPLAEVALAAQAPQSSPPPNGPAQDLTLINGRIHTMDARNTIASTVTIRNGRFAAVGKRRAAVWYASDRLARPHRRAGTHRKPHPQREPGQPPRLSHDPREHDVDSRDPGSAGRAAEECARGPVDHVDGRLASEPVGRASASDAEGAGRRGSRPAGIALRALHGAVRDQ